jgi:antitoxin MazE
MVTKIQKWGNSQGLRVTKEILEQAQLGLGDEVKVEVRKGRIIVEPLSKLRGKYTLEELVSRMPKNSRAEEVDWGQPVGKEVW